MLFFAFIGDTYFEDLANNLILRHLVVFLVLSVEIPQLEIPERLWYQRDISVNRSHLLILINHNERHVVYLPLQLRESVGEDFHFIHSQDALLCLVSHLILEFLDHRDLFGQFKQTIHNIDVQFFSLGLF